MGLVQAHDASHQVRSHLADGGAHLDALLAIDVIEPDGAALKGEALLLDAELGQPLLDKAGQSAWLAHARQVSLHVGHEAGHSCLAETLGNDLQGHRLTCTRGAGNQAVAVGHVAQDADRSVGPVGDVESVLLSVHSLVVYFLYFVYFVCFVQFVQFVCVVCWSQS